MANLSGGPDETSGDRQFFNACMPQGGEENKGVHQASIRREEAWDRCVLFDVRKKRQHNVAMVRTQIQLPDELFARAKKLCVAREISLAELARRGIEYTLSVYSQEADPQWQLPTPRNLGWHGLTDAELKAQAQMTCTETSLSSPHAFD